MTKLIVANGELVRVEESEQESTDKVVQPREEKIVINREAVIDTAVSAAVGAIVSIAIRRYF